MRDQVLLFDGLCGFCHGMARFILARDPGGTMRFAPLQGAFARDVLQRHPGLAGIDSLVLVERNGPTSGVPPLVRSDAVLAIADYLGWPWRAAVLVRLVPRSLRDAAYDVLARHRTRLFGRYDACPLPGPDVRARFID